MIDDVASPRFQDGSTAALTSYEDMDRRIDSAMERIGQRGLSTALRRSSLTAALGSEMWIKPEYGQPTSSYKVRGAYNALGARLAEARPRGVVTFSTGNFGRAVAWSSHQFDVACTVFVSELLPQFKRDALAASGATIRTVGKSQDEAEVYAREFARVTGAMLVSPIEDADVIAGHATIMVEIAAQCPDPGTVIVPISAGGLASGVALVARRTTPAVRLIGVSMERGAAMHASLAAGHPVTVQEEPSLADSLGGGIGGANSPTFPVVRDAFEDLLLVSEDAIGRAMVYARRNEGIVLEGAAATAIALALDPRAKNFPSPIVLIATGGNVDPSVIDALEANA